MPGSGFPTHDLAQLDQAIWNALTTRQASTAVGDAFARRYPPDIAPFAAIADNSAASFAALERLVSPGAPAALFTVEPVMPLGALAVLRRGSVEQMVGSLVEDLPGTQEAVPLGAADLPAMLDLVELTKPGPFGRRTHELGIFLGIRLGGQLVAMAGERMKLAGFTEITVVCTHPEHRGRGYARILLTALSRAITARGEIPFLHVFSDNQPAIALYRRMGFGVRRRMHLTVLGELA
jgi:ribosomal protein S18 acetylase RimI-like enzyme